MATNLLGHGAMLQRMAEALPTHPADDPSSDLSSSYEVIALLVHACFSLLGFRLLGFNENTRIESECTALAPRLPPHWNASFGAHSFVYAHKQSAMTFVIKVDRLGSKVEVRGLAIGAENIHRFERSVRDVVRSSGLPVRIKMDGRRENRSNLEEKLRAVFVSDGVVDDFVQELKTKIIQKLIPKLQQEGYTETTQTNDIPNQPGIPQIPHPDPPDHLVNPNPEFPGLPRPGLNPYPFDDPLAAPPRRPVPPGDFPPPGFEDEYEINRPPRGFVQPGLRGPGPFNIGQDDLNPPGLGPFDPLRPAFVGGGQRGPGFGGMHPTFDDPLFGGRGQGPNADPQAPAGARWDPVGPGGGPRPRQGGHGRFGGGPYGGGFGGDII